VSFLSLLVVLLHWDEMNSFMLHIKYYPPPLPSGSSCHPHPFNFPFVVALVAAFLSSSTQRGNETNVMEKYFVLMLPAQQQQHQHQQQEQS